MIHRVNCLVIGGGAAGFFGAITCAQHHAGLSVLVLEGGRDFLSKVKISGGGRCNVTHHCFEPAQLVLNYPRGAKALRGAFNRFQPQDTIAWFQQRGVALKTEADGRIFPVSDDAQTIAHCLLETAREYGVQLRAQARVVALDFLNPGFRVCLHNGEQWQSERLLLATGSNPSGYRWLEALGHRLEPPVPSLFTFNVPDVRLQSLAGLTVDPVAITLLEPGDRPRKTLHQEGPLLITHWGLSGPAVLKLSAWGARFLHEQKYQARVRLNWLPTHNPESLAQEIKNYKTQYPRRQIRSQCPWALPKRLWQNLLASLTLKHNLTWAELSNQHLSSLARELTQGTYAIIGKGQFKEEFVTCGGLALAEVNFATLESRRCGGLFLAGEILDIDGITGGFNFQAAWTTAWLAGRGMANFTPGAINIA